MIIRYLTFIKNVCWVKRGVCEVVLGDVSFGIVLGLLGQLLHDFH